jgi:hypothetical protein
LTVSATNPTASVALTNPVQGVQYGSDRVLNAVSGTTILIAP